MFTAVFLVLPAVVYAVEADSGLGVDLGLGYATATGLSTTDIRTVVGNILKAFFALLGLVAVVLILYAGVVWMTAAGNEEKISQAKKIMINATIGLTIMMAAYAITAFIFRALSGQGGAGGPGGGGTTGLSGIYCRDCGSAELGKILEYHYPEAGQSGVARNTKIAITMKKPLVLSTVFKNYDDRGTYTTSDDAICNPNCSEAHTDLTCSPEDGDEAGCAGLPYCSYNEDTTKCLLAPELNTDNFKIVPNDSLGDVQNTADKDADFAKRYPDDASGLLLSPAPKAVVTVTNSVFDPNNKGQTIVIKPSEPIGSSSVDMNYRVALRGGPNGIMVWDDKSIPTACARQSETETSTKCAPAFSSLKPDGSYFWSFTTSTALDTTPPQVVFAGPRLVVDPADKPIVRNQLVQIYFDEAVDPSTATGKTASGGFNWINIEAKCLPGTNTTTCPWNQANFAPIEGSLEISNRYRTVEFIPSTACEGISENSCGEPVFCLPKNVELKITVKPSKVDPANPPAGVFPPNGVTDMVGNSFDGNKNGTGEGPVDSIVVNDETVNLNPYDYNQFFTSPPADRSRYNDIAFWRYQVNDEVDLVVPQVTNIKPVSGPPATTEYAAGPSRVPVDLDVTVTWSKTMSPSSMVAGTTVSILSREWQKRPGSPECEVGKTSLAECPRELLAEPTVVIDAGKPVADPETGEDITVMKIIHRPFFSTNDLGWSEKEAREVMADITPLYLPVIRHRVKDDRQNCFYPSQGFECVDRDTGETKSPDLPPNSGGKPSCPDRQPGASFNWTTP